jgi:hypothetical protein
VFQRKLLLSIGLLLGSCTPSGGSDAAVDVIGDLRGTPPGGLSCLLIGLVDDQTGEGVGNALVTVHAEIGREVAFSGGFGRYSTRSGCAGMFVVSVEAPGYERYEWTYRASPERDFHTNVQVQSIEIRLRPLSDAGASDAASAD